MGGTEHEVARLHIAVDDFQSKDAWFVKMDTSQAANTHLCTWASATNSSFMYRTTSISEKVGRFVMKSLPSTSSKISDVRSSFRTQSRREIMLFLELLPRSDGWCILKINKCGICESLTYAHFFQHFQLPFNSRDSLGEKMYNKFVFNIVDLQNTRSTLHALHTNKLARS